MVWGRSDGGLVRLREVCRWGLLVLILQYVVPVVVLMDAKIVCLFIVVCFPLFSFGGGMHKRPWLFCCLIFFGAENGVIPNIPETLIKSISPVSHAVFFRVDNSPNVRSLHSEFLCPVPNDL